MRLGFLASGLGSNMQAVVKACRDGRLLAEPAVVISNKPEAEALQKAQAAGVPVRVISDKDFPDSDAQDAALAAALQEFKVDLVVLAGFLRKLGPLTLAAYQGRIINIHPALLPKFGGKGMYGMRVHEAVLDSGDIESGASVHVVDEEYDRGPVLAQRSLPILPGESPQSLASRVLEIEHVLLVDCLRGIIDGSIVL